MMASTDIEIVCAAEPDSAGKEFAEDSLDESSKSKAISAMTSSPRLIPEIGG